MKIAMFMLLFAIYSWWKTGRESFKTAVFFLAIVLFFSALGASGGEIAFMLVMFYVGLFLYKIAYED